MGVLRVLEVSNKSVSRVLEGSHKGVKGGNTGILRCNNGGCFNCVSMKL